MTASTFKLRHCVGESLTLISLGKKASFSAKETINKTCMESQTYPDSFSETILHVKFKHFNEPQGHYLWISSGLK